jgi:polyhydroxyalkanoate synthase subunit PhaC
LAATSTQAEGVVRVSEHNPENAAAWREAAERRTGSWWEDWAVWADARAGRLAAPPPMGSERNRPLGEAPGDYIRG